MKTNDKIVRDGWWVLVNKQDGHLLSGNYGPLVIATRDEARTIRDVHTTSWRDWRIAKASICATVTK